MKLSLIILTLLAVGCVKKSLPENRGQSAPQVPAGKMVANTDMQYYAIYKYEDGDAICYSIAKTEAISISCVPKSK